MEMKTALDGLIRTLDTAKERICELENMQTSQTEIQREKKKKE